MGITYNFSQFINERLQLSNSEISLLDECTKGTWEEVDGVINIQGDFLASGKFESSKKTIKPLIFGKVSGVFDISDNNLDSLEGCPEETTEFNCSGNLLESLSSGPIKAREYFCANNYLVNLNGISEDAQNISASGNSIGDISALDGRSIEGNLFLHNNFLTNLNGCPKEIGKTLDISECNLTSLEECSKKVNGSFVCSDNELKSLNGGPEFVGGYYDCARNKLTSLKGISSNKMKWIDASTNQIYSVIDLPQGLANSKVGLYKNALPLEILRSQQEFANNNTSTLKDWMEHILKGESNNARSPISLVIRMLNDQGKKEASLEFIERTEIPTISNENTKLLSPIASGINKDSPFMSYVNSNKSLFSKEFLDSLEISADLKDLGF